jgi:hypothetical protein
LLINMGNNESRIDVDSVSITEATLSGGALKENEFRVLSPKTTITCKVDLNLIGYIALVFKISTNTDFPIRITLLGSTDRLTVTHFVKMTNNTISVPMFHFYDLDLGSIHTLIFTGFPIHSLVWISEIEFQRGNFVTRSMHNLYIGNSNHIPPSLLRFSSFNAPDLVGRSDAGQDGFLDIYEQEDLFITAQQLGAQAVRMYTLRVKTSKDKTEGLTKAILGVDNFGESQLIHLDNALALAAKYNVRVVIPFIDNWEWFGGIAAFSAFRAKTRDLFFTDSELIEDWKRALTHVISRRNTVTGILYSEDPYILAWQLGNELCMGDLSDWRKADYRKAVPKEWVSEMVKHIRSLDSNHLIMDGLWSNDANNGKNWPAYLLNSVDILSVHYYGGESSKAPVGIYEKRLLANEKFAHKAKKALIVDEFGIARVEILQKVLSRIAQSKTITGGFMWSIRSQSVNGGAVFHGEYAGYKAYLWPGYSNGPKCSELFPDDNMQVMKALYESSIAISRKLGVEIPPIIPPSSHSGMILETKVDKINEQSISCIHSFGHDGFQNYQRVNLKVRQATGAFSNLISFSFDNSKFVDLDQAQMTVPENGYLYSHMIPINIMHGSHRKVYYRVTGLLRDNFKTVPSQSFEVSIDNLDPLFYQFWLDNIK